MKALIELAQTVNRHKVKDLRTIDNCTSPRILNFYDKILSGELENDKQSSEFFFGRPPSYPQYRKLKNNLRELLLNSAIFIDVNSPKFNDVQKAYYSCYRNLVQVKILLGRYARTPAIELINKTLSYALRYEFSDVALELLRLLRNHHAVKTGNRTKFEKCRRQIQELQETLDAENLAMEYSEELSMLTVSQSNIDQDYFELAERAIKELSKLKVTSYRFLLFRGYIITDYLKNSLQHKELIKSCDIILQDLNEKKYAPPQLSAHFIYLKLVGFGQLGDLERSLEMYSRCLEVFEEGTVRWYNTHDIVMRLLVRKGQYQECLKIVNQVSINGTLKFQPAKRQQSIIIMQAHLYYLAKSGKLETDKIRTFRLRRFLNEIPIYSQDKRGYNITVLVIQILILLQQKKYDLLTDRIEAIEKYTSRYLRNDENFRSNCFIKMLLQIPKRNFHRVAILRHAKPYINRLATVPLEKSKQAYEIEIIPYEHLWEYALESLR